MTRQQRLERLRKRLVERRNEMRARLRDDMTATGTAGGDEGDCALRDACGEIGGRLASHFSEELEEVETALAKFKHGRYGVCEMTDAPIPVARLEALPYTRYTVDAQRMREAEGFDQHSFDVEQAWERAAESEDRMNDREMSLRELEAAG